MATFGQVDTQAGWQNNGGSAFLKYVNRFTLTEDGDVTKLSVYVQNVHASSIEHQIKGIIFDVSANEPNALVGVTPGVTILHDQAAGWVDLTFSTPAHLHAADYCLGIFTEEGGGFLSINCAYTGISRTLIGDVLGFAAGPVTPWTQPDAHDGNNLTVYATYTLPVVAWKGMTVTRLLRG